MNSMNPVRLDPACIKCLLNKHINAAPADAPQEKRVAFMQRMLRLIADAPICEGAPVLVHQIEALEREMFGIGRDFSQEKRAFNALMLTLEPGIRRRIEAAEDPLYAAVQFAMIGNYIDFGAMERVDEEKLMELLSDSARFVPEKAAYDAFRRDVLCAKKLVYLTDNCGEIVMDKLLLSQIRRLNPGAALTVVARGGAVLNDATVEDALFVGMDEYARVTVSGSAIAGTPLSAVSKETVDEIDSADVIIAKGQANFETLRRCGRNVYYIFLCKCDLFAERFAVPRFQGMLLADKDS